MELTTDAMLISNFYNILYLTGFKTLTKDEREAYVLVTKKNKYLFTDGRYINERSKFQFQSSKLILKMIEPGKSVMFHLNNIINDKKIRSLAVEAEDLHVDEFQKLQQTFLHLNIVPVEKLLIKLRSIKTKEEINKIKKACHVSDQCLKEIIPAIKVGDTEKEIAFRLEKWLKNKDCDLAFDPIVAVDANSATPHYATKEGTGKVKKKSVILIDFGAKYENYLSDITRMVFVNPDHEMIDNYQKLLSIQTATIKNVKTGIIAKELDGFCRKLINFSHSLGHGVGLEIHEYPKLSFISEDIIADNQVFTIEPGVYYPGKWGMRIEDTVTVDAVSHRVRVLTKFPKALLSVHL